jgi:hypothetical protein
MVAGARQIEKCRRLGKLRQALEQCPREVRFSTSLGYCEMTEELVFETRQRKAEATCLSQEDVG